MGWLVLCFAELHLNGGDGDGGAELFYIWYMDAYIKVVSDR